MDKEEMKAYKKAYYETHREEIRARKKSYREDNKDKLKAYDKAYRQTPAGKLADSKHKAKRRRSLGYINLNECEVDGWVGHHIDRDYVIFCPLEVHQSVLGHSVTKDRKMNEINTNVYKWFIEYYLKG